MSAVWATSTFSVHVTAAGSDQTLQVGDQRDSADPVVVQLAGSGLFTASPPTPATVTGVQFDYLSQFPGGPDDPSGA